MLISSLTEIVGLGAVVPFLAVMTNPEKVFSIDFLQPVFNFLSISDPTALMLPVTLVFVFSVLLSGMVRILVIWWQARIAHGVGADLSLQIFERTLLQPYIVHISRNSSQIVSSVSTKVDQSVNLALLPILQLFSSAVVVIVIIATLMFIDAFITTLLAVGFGFIYFLIIVTTKKPLRENSVKISACTISSLKTLNEGLGGIREVLVDQTQDYFCEKFRSSEIDRRNALKTNQIIAQIPRYGVESMGIVFIAFTAYFLSASYDGVFGILPMLGVLAVGAQRLLPMVQLFYSSLSLIRGSQSVLSDVLDLLEQEVHQQSDSAFLTKFESAIEFDNVSFRYDINSPDVIKNLSVVIPKGVKFGVVGTTGSGKSTFLDLCLALLNPSRGKVLVDGKEINSENSLSWRSKVAHIPQNIYLSDATILENIAFGVPVNDIDIKLVEQVIKQSQLEDVVSRLHSGLMTKVGENGVMLSGGQRQRIGVARALYKRAEVLILDEATSALDAKTETALMNEISELSQGLTIISVAHREATLKGCDLIMRLENGSVTEVGSVSNILYGKV